MFVHDWTNWVHVHDHDSGGDSGGDNDFGASVMHYSWSHYHLGLIFWLKFSITMNVVIVSFSLTHKSMSRGPSKVIPVCTTVLPCYLLPRYLQVLSTMLSLSDTRLYCPSRQRNPGISGNSWNSWNSDFNSVFESSENQIIRKYYLPLVNINILEWESTVGYSCFVSLRAICCLFKWIKYHRRGSTFPLFAHWKGIVVCQWNNL